MRKMALGGIFIVDYWLTVSVVIVGVVCGEVGMGGTIYKERLLARRLLSASGESALEGGPCWVMGMLFEGQIERWAKCCGCLE